MISVTGKYNSAKIFSNVRHEEAIDQIKLLLDQPFVEGASVRAMPDYHKGAGCTVGFTADLGDKVVPNLVGVDINCGMFVVNLGRSYIDPVHFDGIVHAVVPAGKGKIHAHPALTEDEWFEVDNWILNMHCLPELKGVESLYRSVGTLGGGNHFIELNIDPETDEHYIVIHSGSRNLGKQVCEIYQDMAIEACKGVGDLREKEQDLIAALKADGQQYAIASSLKTLREEHYAAQPVYPRDLCFLTGEQRDYYLDDMQACQKYASLNRKKMADAILWELFGTTTRSFDTFETIHNYINFNDNIIRKGAVSAYAGENLIIPINMRDGSLLCVGKGNADWNFSAPHGAGRLFSRGEAKRRFNVAEFQAMMEVEGVYTTTANAETLDEAPMAYKPMTEIIDNVQDTVEIKKIIKPVYNFKAGE